MKPKTLIGLAAITVVVTVAAVVAVQQRESAIRPQAGGGPLFVDLGDKINAVAKIAITTADGGFTIARDGDTWGVVEKSGYPALFDKVKATILGLAEMRGLATKTDDAARYAEIGLADPGAEEGAARRLALLDDGGAELAAILLGDSGRGGGNRIYVRRPDDPQSWLAAADLDIGASALDWIDRTVLRITHDRVNRVVITQPDGGALIVGRKDRAEPRFSIADIPDGMKVSSASMINGLGGAIGFVTAEDVIAAADLPAAEEGATTARFETFDGLVVTVSSTTHDGALWAQIEAAFDPAIVVSEESSTAGEGEGEGAAVAKTEPETDPAAAASAEAEALNARHAGWAYALQEYTGEQMTRALADLIEEDVPEQPEDGAAPAE
ncbi:MAG: DUF4340 domain-containing protein [Alphaproteobacteria bacterium]|nr:DUF4340 domain-containing protein [Alphaproteobacteria bacterium]